MRLNNKRQAEDELRPSRASKRQAAIPTTRITRSSTKRSANNGSAVQLNPGLPMAPRRRKKPAPPAPTHQGVTPVEVPSRVDSLLELTGLPATAHASTPSQPAEQAPAKTASVIYAVGITPDGRELCAPIRIGSKSRARSQPQVVTASVATDHMVSTGTWAGRVSGPDAADPGGPAPIAYMGGDCPMAITYTTNVPPHEDAQRHSSQRRRREPSHTSVISPLSGPGQVCSIPTPSRADPPCASWGSDSTNTETPDTPVPFKLDWTRLNPDWLNRGDEMWKAPGDEPRQAVTEATYLVDSLEEAAELFANEIKAQVFEQDIEPPVVDVFVPEDTSCSQLQNISGPATVEDDAGSFSFDTMDWVKTEDTPTEATKMPNLDSDGATSRLTTPTKYTTAPVPPNRRESFNRTVKSVFRQTATPVEDANNILAPTTAEVSCPPQSQQRTAQRIANLQREKELRERLIEMRKARNKAQTPCVQNVLVREADGSMSIITTQDTLVPSWGLEEDQYSVEEYEEDSVSY